MAHTLIRDAQEPSREYVLRRAPQGWSGHGWLRAVRGRPGRACCPPGLGPQNRYSRHRPKEGAPQWRVCGPWPSRQGPVCSAESCLPVAERQTNATLDSQHGELQGRLEFVRTALGSQATLFAAPTSQPSEAEPMPHAVEHGVCRFCHVIREPAAFAHAGTRRLRRVVSRGGRSTAAARTTDSDSFSGDVDPHARKARRLAFDASPARAEPRSTIRGRTHGRGARSS